MAGLSPKNADEVNNLVGMLLRQFTDCKESVSHHRSALAGVDLTQPPYEMTAGDEVLIKSALNDLGVALDAIDMTFINRLTGLW